MESSRTTAVRSPAVISPKAEQNSPSVSHSPQSQWPKVQAPQAELNSSSFPGKRCRAPDHSSSLVLRPGSQGFLVEVYVLANHHLDRKILLHIAAHIRRLRIQITNASCHLANGTANMT